MQYQPIQFAKAPLHKDLTLKGAGDDGSDLTIPAGTPADQVGKFYTNLLSKKLSAENESDLESQKQQGRMQLANTNNAARQQRAAIAATGQNVVAFDPEYQNADGSKGANVVLDKAAAQQRGLFNYKVDPSVVNANVAGFNDVQNKLNQLATVVNDPKRMSQVQPELAAAILARCLGTYCRLSLRKGPTPPQLVPPNQASMSVENSQWSLVRRLRATMLVAIFSPGSSGLIITRIVDYL